MKNLNTLSQDLAMPLAAVRKVLNSAVRFRKLWEKGEISETDFRTIKSEVHKLGYQKQSYFNLQFDVSKQCH